MIRNIFAALVCAVIFFVAQNVSANGYITYQANVEGLGWMEPVNDGEVCGTTMQARRLEALIINFDGGIKYSAHVQNVGWLGWAKNGEPAGTAGAALRMEALQIKLVDKGSDFDRGDKPAFAQKIKNAPTV